MKTYQHFWELCALLGRLVGETAASGVPGARLLPDPASFLPTVEHAAE